MSLMGEVPCCAIGMAVAQVSLDPYEEVPHQKSCTCLSESEIFTVIHQLKKGMASGPDKISPEMPKLGRDELVEDPS